MIGGNLIREQTSRGVGVVWQKARSGKGFLEACVKSCEMVSFSLFMSSFLMICLYNTLVN